MYRRALAIEIANFGPQHPRVGFCANNLGALMLSRGRLDEADVFCRQALSIFETRLGPRHPNVAVCLENYAEVLRRQHHPRKAAVCAARAARIIDRVERVNDDGVGITGIINPWNARFRLVAGPSRIHRIGVFAAEPIPAGQRVIEYTGELVARRESKRRWDPARSSLFQLNTYWTIDGAVGGSGAEYINHCCMPNMRAKRWRGGIHYFSKRRIARGEELTVDYKYDVNLPPIPCNCGAEKCRGVMNNLRPAQERRTADVKN
jgi:hypothetical protein